MQKRFTEAKVKTSICWRRLDVGLPSTTTTMMAGLTSSWSTDGGWKASLKDRNLRAISLRTTATARLLTLRQRLGSPAADGARAAALATMTTTGTMTSSLAITDRTRSFTTTEMAHSLMSQRKQACSKRKRAGTRAALSSTTTAMGTSTYLSQIILISI